MDYSCELLIEAPQEKVVALFKNPENLGHWQKELVSHEHLSGTQGEKGAKSKYVLHFGKRKMEMIETILDAQWPDQIKTEYETPTVLNSQVNYFEKKNGHTLWTSKNTFAFRGLFMRLMGFVMGKKPFSKQTMKYMVAFKAFAEEQASH